MSNQQSVATANAVSGERTVAAVTFPITGDKELDLISGFLAVIHDSGTTPTTRADIVQVNRALHYLCKRSDDELEMLRNQIPQWYPNQGLGSVSIGPSGIPPSSPPSTPPGYSCPTQWVSTSGGTTNSPGLSDLLQGLTGCSTP